MEVHENRIKTQQLHWGLFFEDLAEKSGSKNQER